MPQGPPANAFWVTLIDTSGNLIGIASNPLITTLSGADVVVGTVNTTQGQAAAASGAWTIWAVNPNPIQVQVTNPALLVSQGLQAPVRSGFGRMDCIVSKPATNSRRRNRKPRFWFWKLASATIRHINRTA